MVQSRLEAEGFHPLDVQQSPHYTLAGNDEAYYVEVPTSEAHQVRAWLTENGFGHLLVR